MSKNILVVDDSLTIQKCVEISLAKSGYQLSYAGSAQQALDIAKTASPDLIILDTSLPDRSGLEFCKELKADPHFKQSEILVMSGAQSQITEAHVKQAGARAFLVKPFETQAMATKVNECFNAAPKDSQPSPAQTASPAQTIARAMPVDSERAMPVDNDTTVPPQASRQSSAATASNESDMSFDLDVSDFSDLMDAESGAAPQDNDFSQAVHLDATDTPPSEAASTSNDGGENEMWNFEDDFSTSTDFNEQPVGSFDLESENEAISSKSMDDDFSFDQVSADSSSHDDLAPPQEAMRIEESMFDTPLAENEGAPHDALASAEGDLDLGGTQAIGDFDEIQDETEVTFSKQKSGPSESDNAIAEPDFNATNDDFELNSDGPATFETPDVDLNAPTFDEPSMGVQQGSNRSSGAVASSDVKLSDAQIETIVTKVFQNVIERIAWEVVPEMAEKIIKEEIQRLTKDA